MSKSEEYYKKVESRLNYDMESSTQRAMRLKGIIVAETMNHSTLEDVREMLRKNEGWAKTSPSGWMIDLDHLLTELEKLKL